MYFKYKGVVNTTPFFLLLVVAPMLSIFVIYSNLELKMRECSRLLLPLLLLHLSNYGLTHIFDAQLRMRKLVSIIFAFSVLAARSQAPGRTVQFSPPPVHNNFYKDADLAVVKDKYPPFASGSPYFIDEWLNADVQLEQGDTIKDVKMRLDLVENAMQYISPEGRELVASGAIRSVVLKDSTAGNQFKFVNSFFLGAKKEKSAWFLELVSGHACFYKQILKSINEPKNYVPGGTEITINSSEEYFIYADSVLLPVKKIKDVPGLLHYKFKEVDAYMDKTKLSGRSESGFIELIKYYNSLF